jgi:hypothetical protein
MDVLPPGAVAGVYSRTGVQGVDKGYAGRRRRGLRLQKGGGRGVGWDVVID